MHTYMYIHTYIHIHTFIHITYTQIITYIHTYTHTYIHTYIQCSRVAESLQTKINFTQNLTKIVTGHGNIKSYLHRFRIIEAPDCPCGNGNQIAEHTLLECGILQEEKGTPNSGSGEDGQLAHKKRYALQKTLQSIRKIHKNNGQNK